MTTKEEWTFSSTVEHAGSKSRKLVCCHSVKLSKNNSLLPSNTICFLILQHFLLSNPSNPAILVAPRSLLMSGPALPAATAPHLLIDCYFWDGTFFPEVTPQMPQKNNEMIVRERERERAGTLFVLNIVMFPFSPWAVDRCTDPFLQAAMWRPEPFALTQMLAVLEPLDGWR